MADELPGLIDKEVQAKPRRLFVDVVADAFGKTFDGELVVVAHPVEELQPFVIGLAEELGIHLGKGLILQRLDHRQVYFPGAPTDAGIGRFERRKLAARVEVVLKLRDVFLLGIVTLIFVEHLDKDIQHWRAWVAANRVGLLVDVEQNAVRRDAHRPLQVAL